MRPRTLLKSVHMGLPVARLPRLYVGADRACVSGGLGGMTERYVGRTQHSCPPRVSGLLPGGAPASRRLVLGQRLGDLAATLVPRPPGLAWSFPSSVKRA